MVFLALYVLYTSLIPDALYIQNYLVTKICHYSKENFFSYP